MPASLLPSRRQAIKRSAIVTGLLVSTGLFSELALAFSKDAFDAGNIPDALSALGAGNLAESQDVILTGPEIAENGTVVPFAISTTLPGVKRLLLLVEKNPAALIALFNVSDSVEPAFSTRAKMSQTSDVYAVAILADGKAMYAKKEVKVTLGGCGG